MYVWRSGLKTSDFHRSFRTNQSRELLHRNIVVERLELKLDTLFIFLLLLFDRQNQLYVCFYLFPVLFLFLSFFGLIYRNSRPNFHLIYLCATYMARLVYAWLFLLSVFKKLHDFRFTDLNKEWLQSKKSSESDKVAVKVARSCHNR